MDSKPTVLITDDTPSNIQTLAGCLKDQYNIKVATNGERCLELAQAKEAPDLILLDVMMPDMDGYQVLESLQSAENTADIPVIFVTGKNEEKEEEEGLLRGAVDYITKPFRPTIVNARIKTHIQLKQHRDRLRNMAIFDQLTGLYNRHYLTATVSQKISQAHRHSLQLSLLLIDIDHFKRINDDFGHATGDLVLQQVAHLMQKTFRDEDTVARLGGEEFVVILDQCGVDSALSKAETLRKEMESLRPIERKTTLSIGVSVLNKETKEDFDSLLNRADQALYQAKEHGRNTIELSKPNA